LTANYFFQNSYKFKMYYKKKLAVNNSQFILNFNFFVN